jgi:hypothetical protein
MTNECTTDDCRNMTSTYLCSQCVSDLQSWIARIPILLVELRVTIARLDYVRPAGGGGGGSKPGPAAPLNLDAWQISENLKTVGKSAKDYAHAEDAAGMAWLIQDWCTKAEMLILGPEEPPVNLTEIRKKLESNRPDAMQTSDVVKWLKENARIHVTSMDIRNWVRRRKLVAVEQGRYPTYHPYDVLNAWHDTRNTERARVG